MLPLRANHAPCVIPKECTGRARLAREAASRFPESLPAASNGPVTRSVGRYSQQFGRLYVCVPIAGHGPCPWVGRDKSRLADFDGGVKVFPDPSIWALMLFGFAGLGYVGFLRARRASVSFVAGYASFALPSMP